MPPLEAKYSSLRIKRRLRAAVRAKLLEILPPLLSCKLEPDELDGLLRWDVTPKMVKIDFIRLGWWRRRRNFGMADLYIMIEAQAFQARKGRQREYSRAVTKELWPLMPDGVSLDVWVKLVDGGWSACVGGQNLL